MKNLSEIICTIIVVILIIVLIAVSAVYIVERRQSSEKLNEVLNGGMEIYELHKEMDEIENQILLSGVVTNQIESVTPNTQKDVRVEEVEIEDVPENIFNLVCSFNLYNSKEDLKSVNFVYTKANKTSKDYDVLHDYSFDLKKYSSTGSVKLVISEEGEPIKDSIFKSSENVSNFDGNEAVIYQFENKYIAEFEANGKYIYIEATGYEDIEFMWLIQMMIENCERAK